MVRRDPCSQGKLGTHWDWMRHTAGDRGGTGRTRVRSWPGEDSLRVGNNKKAWASR